MIGYKVLIISERWWPDGTGGVLASHLIACVLRDAGFKLTIIHGTKEPVKLNGVRYVYSSLLSVRNKQRLWLNCSILSRERWFLKLVSGSDIVYIPRYCYPLISVAKEFSKRVIVHLHDYQPVSYNAVVLKNGDKIIPKGFRDVVKLEILEHSSTSRALGAVLAPLNSFCRIWLKEADVIICVSKRQAEIIGKMAPELASKLRVIYNPLPDVPIVRKKLDDYTFLYLGGDSYIKGFNLLLRASQKILEKGLPAKFLLAGTFKKKDGRFIIDALNKKFNSSFHLLGFIPHNEIFKLHSRSCALLLPSICEETSSYAVLESMLAGTLPIASRVGGVPEIVEGTFAERLLFMPNNVLELAEKMEYVLSMKLEHLADIGLSLREAVLKKFSEESIRKKLMKVFSG